MKKLLSSAFAALLLFACDNDEPALSSDKLITSFSFLTIDNPALLSDVHGIITAEGIHCTMPTGTLITSLKPAIEHQDVSVNPAPGTAVNFTNPVNYTVTAEDGSTLKYTVYVTVTPPVLSSEKAITSFSFLKSDNPSLANDVTGIISGQNIHCTFTTGAAITALKPTIAHTGNTLNPASGAVNNFSTPATYTVVAEDGSTSSYTVTVEVVETGPFVYVGGGQVISGTRYAKVWKNGVATNLSNGSYNTSITSVFVSGNILYAAGNEIVGNSYAKYWKIENGVELPTAQLNETINDAFANSIFVSANNDVYVAGQENHGAGTGIIAKVWKNGTATALTTKSGAATSVFVSGADVYLAGWEETTTGWNAKVWKNGVATVLSPDKEKSQARAVFVSGSDVYVAGQYWNGTAYVLTVWKNGAPEIINPNTLSSEVSSIFVYQGDVYLAGTEIVDNSWKATIWKNGTPTILSHVNTSDAKSVYVHNGDVYVAGWEPDSNGKLNAMLWKNGVPTLLAADAFAYSVIVK